MIHKLLEIIFSLPYSVDALLRNTEGNIFFSLSNDEFVINSLSQGHSYFLQLPLLTPHTIFQKSKFG